MASRLGTGKSGTFFNSVLLLHPIESFVIIVCKLVLLGQKYSLMILSKMASSSLDNIWAEPDSQDLYWTNGKRPFTQGLV